MPHNGEKIPLIHREGHPVQCADLVVPRVVNFIHVLNLNNTFHAFPALLALVYAGGGQI